MRLRALLLPVSVCLFLHPPVARAQWTPDGVPLSATIGNQTVPAAATDGSGGAIVAWSDTRSGNADIYVQRVDAFGAPQWGAPNGLAVRTGAGNQYAPVVVSDGAGGAIIAWLDDQGGSVNVYGQLVDASGNLQWTVNGVTICNAPQNQEYLAIATDGAGGAIVAWQDPRDGSNMVADIYAQRVNAGGAVQWASDGVAVCTAANAQNRPVIAPDGAGGAVIAWSDFRSGASLDIYAQRLNSAGAAQWTPDGVALCTAANDQDAPSIASDGGGGAIAAWSDFRGADPDIYAQRINTSGAVQWTPDGEPLCNQIGSQIEPKIVADGSGGAMIAWVDGRDSGTTGNDIYAQRVDSAGSTQWAPGGGVALCTATGDQLFARPVVSSAGGMIAVWMDLRSGGLNYDLYAQRISAAGVVQWTPDGKALCTATNGQLDPVIVPDGAGGAIAAWSDFRSGTNSDVYAIRVSAGGMVPVGVGGPSPSPAAWLGYHYPNPFSAGTTVDVTLSRESDVRVEVFDARGRPVRTMNMGRLGAGMSRLDFDGRDDRARPLPSGVYFYRAHAPGNAAITRKIVIQR